MSETTKTVSVEPKKYVNDKFVEGAVRGLKIAIGSMLPNMVMAYVLIRILNLTGLLDMVGVVCAPIMGIFGLPGEAAMAILGAWMSASGGVGTAISLFNEGILTGNHLAILAPCMVLVGGQMQYLGRLLAMCEIKPKHWGVMIGISYINGMISMWIMNILVNFF